jgi:hypothetical protein
MTTNQWVFVEDFTNPDIQDITRDPNTLVITITNRDYDIERTEKQDDKDSRNIEPVDTQYLDRITALEEFRDCLTEPPP